MTLSIDAAIGEANNLPGCLYRDPEFFRRVRDELFPGTWHLLPEPPPEGVAPFNWLEGCLDEPLLWSRDGAELACLSNVCTHRGRIVAETGGTPRGLRCAYHGRRFDLGGRCLASPGFEPPFPERDHLPRLRTVAWQGLHFGSLAPRFDLRDVLEPIGRRVGLDGSVGELSESESRDWVLDVNWMLYCDNYLEGLHVPYVHPGLSQALDLTDYPIELGAWSSTQIGIVKDEAEGFVFPAEHPDASRRVGGYYFWLFPSTMLNFYPWGLSLNQVTPLDVERTRISYRTYVSRPDRVGSGAGADLSQVELEDQAVVRSVQSGVKSRLYRRGRYAPEAERAVHHFHRLLLQVLA